MEVLDRVGVRDQEVSSGGAYGEDSCLPRHLKSIELFAGAGGLSVGVARAGFKHLAVVEYNPHACSTLRANKDRNISFVRDWPIIEADVRTLNFHEFDGQVDLLSGGPPCQPFSLGGKHRGSKDSRDLFPELIRAIRESRPKVILVENVKGLLRKAFAEYFDYILAQLESPDCIQKPDETWFDHLCRLKKAPALYSQDLGYNLTFRCINTADYGVAQKRWRVIILGIRKDLNRVPEFPRPTCSADALLWDKWVSGKYWERHGISRKERGKPDGRTMRRVELLKTSLFCPPTDPWRTVRDALVGLPDPEFEPHKAARFLNHTHNPGARSYPGHTGSPLDEPAKALKAGDHGVPGGENMLVRLDGSIRYFTVRESARLQDFADDFFFPGSWTNVMRQLGNAVPSRVGQIMATALERILKEPGGRSDRL